MQLFSKKPFYKNITPYIIAFLLPCFILSGYKMLYVYFSIKEYPPHLSTIHIICLGISCLSFFVYTRSTLTVKLPSMMWNYVFSLAYALCSYSISQQKEILPLLIFALFPILILTYEYMLLEKTYFPFIIACAITLNLNPALGVPVILLLFVLSLIILAYRKELNLGNIIHYTSCFILGGLCSCARLFFFYAPYWQEHSDYTYNGFSTTYSIPAFISRLFSGNTPSTLFALSGQYMELTIGSLFLLLIICYFFQSHILLREKIYVIFITILLILELNLSPLHYVFNGFVDLHNLSINESFLIVFGGLYIAARGLKNLKHTKTHLLLCSCVGIFVLKAISILWFQHNYAQKTILISICIILVYSVAIVLYQKKYHGMQYILGLLVIMEIILNITALTNMNICPKNISTDAKWCFESASSTATKNTSSAITSQYSSFLKKHTYKQLDEVIESLDSLNLKYRQKQSLLKSKPEIYNIYCQKLGFNKKLLTPITLKIKFTPSKNISISEYTSGIYNIYFKNEGDQYISYEFTSNTSKQQDVVVWDNIQGYFLLYPANNSSTNFKGYMACNATTHVNYNIQIQGYTINKSVLEQLPTVIDKYKKNNKSSYLTLDYIGVGLNYFGIMCLIILLCYDKRIMLYKKLYKIKKIVTENYILNKIGNFIKKNNIYALSFIIPFCVFIAMMIFTNCTPFGDNSFFDEDGFALTLPSKLDTIYNAKTGNKYLSMNGGYNYSLYTNNTLVDILSFVYKKIPLKSVAPLLLMGVSLCIGLSGLSMTFYLTHRQKHSTSKDIRLLFPAIIYSLNGYMLSIHGFTSWYFTLMALPLLIYATEQLLYCKKSLLYIILLSYCIITNLMLGMYICIFLVLFFMTQHFINIRDFFKCGIRFAIASIIAAGNSYFVIYNTLSSSENLYYKENDSILPTLGFHGNFIDQWKNYMLFVPTSAVTKDNNYAALYCSIFALGAILLYYLSKSIKTSDKIRNFVLIAFLSISFNGKILSYMWNGMHYQSKVPNRYVFLLMFIIATMVYDVLLNIHKKRFTCSLSAVLLCCFFVICYTRNSSTSNLTLFASLAFCIIYTLLTTYSNHRLSRKYKTALLLMVFLVEIISNSLYCASHWRLNAISLYNDISDQRITTSENNSGYRYIYPAQTMFNAGLVYNTPTTSAFNSFVNNNQRNLNSLYGLLSGGNTTTANNISTPIGLSTASIKYIMVPYTATHTTKSLKYYRYLGTKNNYYIFENTNALSLGLYAPNEIVHFTKDTVLFPPKYFNGLSLLMTGNHSMLYYYETLHYNDSSSSNNSFYFTNENGQKITYDEAKEIYKTMDNGQNYKLQMHIRYKVKQDGYVYLYPNEFVGLKYAKAGEIIETTILFPSASIVFSDSYNIVTMDETVCENLQKTLFKNQLENISIKNDTITGTTNYEKDGYTMLSLAYDKGWSAYIDGKKVAVENPYDAGIYIKTPAGKHTLTLKFEPYGMKSSRMISACFWILTALVYGLQRLIRRRKKTLMSE